MRDYMPGGVWVNSKESSLLIENSFMLPRERFIEKGAQSVSTDELLAILLRTGYKGKSVLALAKQVIEELQDGAYGLNSITPQRLRRIKGIGKEKAVTICAAVELGRRLGEMAVKQHYADFSSPQAVASYVMERMRYEPQEHFVVALLNAKNKLIKIETISKGGLTASLAEQRMVFRKAVEANAAAMVLIHNHPTGDPTASEEDIGVTRTFVKAGKLMGIPILDHIIIGDGIYTSLCEEGYV